MNITKKRYFGTDSEIQRSSLFIDSDSDVESGQNDINSNDDANFTMGIKSQSCEPKDETTPSTKPLVIDLEDETEINFEKPQVPKASIDSLLSFSQKRSKTDEPNHIVVSNEPKWAKYIGSLTLEAWATRPTFKPLRYQQKFEVRSLTPKKMTFGKTIGKFQKINDSAVIRLFSIPDGREVGRLPTDVTEIFAPLLNMGYLKLNTTVIMETDFKLSIGDSFYVQIDCLLTDKAFVDLDNEVTEPQLKNFKKGTFNFSSETEEETILRTRQSSLAKLFDKLGLISTEKKNERDNNVITINEIDDEISNSDVNKEELSLDQLKQFYQANQQSALLEGLPENTKPSSNDFKLNLRPYQCHGLSWMLAREKELDLIEQLSNETPSQNELSTQTKKTIEEEGLTNPLWKEYEWPKSSIYSNEDEFFYANLYSGQLSIQKPIIKSALRGGILADEMGLGKTILTYSLILSCPKDKTILPENNDYAYRTTLIVVPMSLLTQWHSEFNKANNNPKFRCLIYYGDQTYPDLRQVLCRNSDDDIATVVITTYGSVLNEYSKYFVNKENVNSNKSGLFSVKFFRIVLDEGHTIRNRTAKTTQAIYKLRSSRKWVLTGTPVINRLDDLYSLIKFLNLDPWQNFSYWKTFVTLPFEERKIAQTLEVVKCILEPILLRRTKNMKQKNGLPLVVLPEKEIKIVEIEFNEKEKKLYNWFKDRATRSFKDGLAKGDLLKRYTQILTHILRLRQICCHVDLLGSTADLNEEVDMKSVNETIDHPLIDNNDLGFSKEEAKRMADSIYDRIDFENSECSICTSLPISCSEMGITCCGHAFCFNCLLEHIAFQEKNGQQATCPNCREVISKYKIFKVKKSRIVKRVDPFAATNGQRKYQLFAFDPDRTSSKIQALISHLRIIHTEGSGQQVVVFSQFSSYLDIIEKELKIQADSDFEVYKFDGRLAMTERKQVLEKFNTVQSGENAKTVVLLLSLKAGGVGLNLTVASKAFMMDPWWSPSIEDQAIDRIHRIGQEYNVKVVRFIMKDSIETKMLKIQQRKKQIGEAVGVEEEEKSKRRIEEIQMLFEE